jgi:hypothetical protein
VLDILTEKDFRRHSKNDGGDGTDVYTWKGATSRVMVANRPDAEF